MIVTNGSQYYQLGNDVKLPEGTTIEISFIELKPVKRKWGPKLQRVLVPFGTVTKDKEWGND